MKGTTLRLDAARYSMPNNDRPGLLQLHLNENLLSSALEAQNTLSTESITAESALLHRYPKNGSAMLQCEIAAHAGCCAQSVVVTNGSSELLRLLLISLLGHGDRLLLPSPSWGFYRTPAQMIGAEVIEYNLEEVGSGFVYNLDLLRRAIVEHKPRAVIVCSPNNPTGNTVNASRLIELVDEFTQVDFVLDQAYHGFVPGEANDVCALKEAARRRNLFVTRTFSKFMALANARIGYMICEPSRATRFSALAPVFGLSSLSQTMAAKRLNDRRLHEAMQEEFGEIRLYVFQELQRMNGIRAYWPDANFILIRCSGGCIGLGRELLSQGFVVKKELINGSPDFLRITLADRTTMEGLLQAIRSLEVLQR